ncbi:sugar kinase [Saccharomonospora sp. CUA-673]|uniref:carbohydrate kinase family protein n=1 Tax=Saccharomonospora sp. CUA-673 TaxID=1904969 RepID=UPI00095C14BD|nr:carbohydrate kinase [Saccharomonospora sp. CUA-673]OLT39957.1 sugar kinase [Saccharomonospora sp. CUA-673]
MIVSGGEALVDLVPAESDATLLAPRLGGGPYNVALAAGRLDVPTAFLSRLSTDRFGDALLARLESSGVDTSLVQRGSEPTTLAVVALDGTGAARYSFYTEGTADRLVADPGPLPEATTVLSLGTLGMVLEPGAGAYETVLHREAARGVLTALDPNIRADMIDDPDAYRRRFASWLPSVRLLKVSDDDAAWLAGGAPAEEAAAEWIAAGVDAVVLTRGGAGLSVLTAAGEVASAPAADVRVVDTIGAGDTVHGALLAWLVRQEVSRVSELTPDGWSKALAFAARAAGVTVSRSGAEPPTSEELTHDQNASV